MKCTHIALLQFADSPILQLIIKCESSLSSRIHKLQRRVPYCAVSLSDVGNSNLLHVSQLVYFSLKWKREPFVSQRFLSRMHALVYYGFGCLWRSLVWHCCVLTQRSRIRLMVIAYLRSHQKFQRERHRQKVEHSQWLKDKVAQLPARRVQRLRRTRGFLSVSGRC